MRKFKVVTACALVIMVANAAFSQSIWTSRPERGSVDIEIFKPNFKDGTDITLPTTATFITGRFVSSRLIIVGELPVAHAGFEGGTSETAVGNPYVGLEFRNPVAPMFAELGVRIPVMSDNKVSVMSLGIVSDIDRLEAFVPDFWSITGKLNLYAISSTNVTFRVRGGATFLLAQDGGDDEWFLDGSAQLGFDGPLAFLIGGVSGRYFLSGDGNFEELSGIHLAGTLGLKLGKLRPGIFARVPLDENFLGIGFKDNLDVILGVNLGVQLR